MKWLFFSYSLPTEPSKARVFVWRQLKKLGAVHFQTVWVAPYSPERVQEVNKLVEYIQAHRGKGIVITGKILSPGQEERLLEAFTSSRNEEYQELIAKCNAYLQEIEQEIQRENFIFAEVEENEEELDKLKHWFIKIERRDVLKAPLRKTALEKLKRCEKVFHEFARLVWERAQSSREY